MFVCVHVKVCANRSARKLAKEGKRSQLTVCKLTYILHHIHCMLKTKTRVKTTATKAAGDEKGANFQFLFVRQIRHCFNSGREGESGAL